MNPRRPDSVERSIRSKGDSDEEEDRLSGGTVCQGCLPEKRPVRFNGAVLPGKPVSTCLFGNSLPDH